MNQCMFSIIVVSLNAEKYIESTIHSVLSQTYDNYEIIIKDGDSMDETVNRIPKDKRIKTYIEADISVYDAMNQGIAYASGDYIYFLNCGDKLSDENVLENIASNISSGFDYDIYYGDVKKEGILIRRPLEVTKKALSRATICHQALFYKSTVFEECGGFDLNYRLCADYEHLVRCFFLGKTFCFVPIIICDYEGGGLSDSNLNVSQIKIENNRIKNIYFSNLDILKYEIWRFLRYFYPEVYTRKIHKIVKRLNVFK